MNTALPGLRGAVWGRAMPNNKVQPPGRPTWLNTTKSRHVGPVGCNGFLG